MAYQPTNDPGPSFNVAVNPKGEVTAQMDTTFPNLETGQQFQNICKMQPGLQYPSWPQAISSFVYGQLDKPPQEEVDPSFAAQFEKPYISSAPDPYILVPPPPLLAAAPFHAGSQTPLHDPPAPQAILPVPPPIPQKIMQPQLPPRKPVQRQQEQPAPDDQVCAFKNSAFHVSKLPSCMLTSMKTFFYYVSHWKSVPGGTFAQKLQHLFMDNNRLFYVLAWLVILLFAWAGLRKVL